MVSFSKMMCLAGQVDGGAGKAPRLRRPGRLSARAILRPVGVDGFRAVAGRCARVEALPRHARHAACVCLVPDNLEQAVVMLLLRR